MVSAVRANASDDVGRRACVGFPPHSLVFYKRVLPLLWFGTLLAATAFVLINTGADRREWPAILGIAAFLTALGMLLYQRLIAGFVDEVWLDGDTLLVTNREVQTRIALRDVLNLHVMTTMIPRRITLQLRIDSPLARQISFMPTIQHGNMVSGEQPDAVADELIARIKTLRAMAR